MPSYCSLRRIKSKNVCIIERQGKTTAVRIISKKDAQLLFDMRKRFEGINKIAQNPCCVLSVFPCDIVFHCLKYE